MTHSFSCGSRCEPLPEILSCRRQDSNLHKTVLETAASAVGLLRPRFRSPCTNLACGSAHPQSFSQCSEQDSNLHQRDSHSRASAGWATGAKLSDQGEHKVRPIMDRGGNRTLIVR